MANLEQLERLKQGVKEWNQWRLDHPEVQPDLTYAILRYANLSRVNLREANLSEANLRMTNLGGADLYNANLREANLYNANLSKTDLSYANFGSANLSYADLSGANLREADLGSADLSSANLRETCFCYTYLGHTIFTEVDLSTAKLLEHAIHYAPSTVNINTVIFSPDERTRLHFLRGVGFTETQIDSLPSLLTPRPIQYYSLFICYAHEDEVIAKRLYTDLRKKDVTCWSAPHDLRPGTPILRPTGCATR